MAGSHGLDASAKHALVFLLLTFAWTWAWWGYAIAAGHAFPDGLGFVAYLVGGAGPVFAALAVVSWTRDGAGRRAFWRRVVTPRGLSASWWLLIVAIAAGIWTAAVLIAISLGLDWGGPLAIPAFAGVAGALALALAAGFVEEPGWRGLAHDSMRARFDFGTTVLVIGVMWALWHVPLYFFDGTFQHDVGFASGGFWLFSAALVLLSVLYGWVAERTGSILSAVLMHGLTNATYEVVPVSDAVRLIALALLAVMAIAILWRMARRERDAGKGLQAQPA